MPRRVNPCSYLPRRLQIVVSLTAFVLFCILFLGSSSSEDTYLSRVPLGPQIEQGAHKVVDHLPSLPKEAPFALNPFRTPAHRPPPEQADSSSADAKWFSHFNWRNSFSSSTTQDDRLVLPPQKERPPVYTYFDAESRRKDEKSKNAEQELLQTWRRAWWAQGFKPVVLSRAEATHNPLYTRVQSLELEPEMEAEMLRWLAWGNMGTGILCNWLAVPMTHYHDPLLAFLRRGEYPSLTRYKDLESGLFVGMKSHIEKAITVALGNPDIEHVKSMAEAVPPEAFKVDPDHEGIAFYSSSTIQAHFRLIDEKLQIEEKRADGLAMLPYLINSHLHMTWQNTFSKGIAVLKPVAQNTTYLVEPAIDIARNLSQCAQSPIPASCPPNRPSCFPCVSTHPMTILTPPVFRNTSNIFTIGTVPHPYTLQSLINTKAVPDARFLRRKTKRDVWILAATKEIRGTGVSSFARLTDMKDAVASEYGSARSLWLTAEDPIYLRTEKDMQDLDWAFGFSIPRHALKSGKSETPVPGPERRPPPPKQEFDGPVPSDKQLATQKSLVENARTFIKAGDKSSKIPSKALRDSVEAWNLADTEVWRFVRAYNARRQVERRKWEEDEKNFLGKGVYDRWKDTMGG